MLAAMSVEGATSGAVFHAYLERVLLPELRRAKPDAVLVMDNLGAHKTPKVRGLLDRSGFPYRDLPSYSPDLSPIEPAWAQVKAELRRVAARDEGAGQGRAAPGGGARRGRRSRPSCAGWRRATRAPYSGRPAPRSTGSRPRTPRPTSATAATNVPTNPNAVHFTILMAAAKSIRTVGCGARGRSW